MESVGRIQKISHIGGYQLEQVFTPPYTRSYLSRKLLFLLQILNNNRVSLHALFNNWIENNL